MESGCTTYCIFYISDHRKALLYPIAYYKFIMTMTWFVPTNSKGLSCSPWLQVAEAGILEPGWYHLHGLNVERGPPWFYWAWDVDRQEWPHFQPGEGSRKDPLKVKYQEPQMGQDIKRYHEIAKTWDIQSMAGWQLDTPLNMQAVHIWRQQKQQLAEKKEALGSNTVRCTPNNERFFAGRHPQWPNGCNIWSWDIRWHIAGIPLPDCYKYRSKKTKKSRRRRLRRLAQRLFWGLRVQFDPNCVSNVGTDAIPIQPPWILNP